MRNSIDIALFTVNPAQDVGYHIQS